MGIFLIVILNNGNLFTDYEHISPSKYCVLVFHPLQLLLFLGNRNYCLLLQQNLDCTTSLLANQRLKPAFNFLLVYL